MLNTSTGLYQQSVTLTARMWPPIEAGSPKIIWNLPVVIWSLIIGFVVIIIILASLFFCCWLLPRHRKILSPTRDCTSTTVNIGRCGSFLLNLKRLKLCHSADITVGKEIISKSGGDDFLTRRSQAQSFLSYLVAHNHHPTPTDQNYIIMATNTVIPTQYSTPQQLHQYPTHSLYAMCSSGHGSTQNIPETHKSLWALNPLCSSNGGKVTSVNSLRITDVSTRPNNVSKQKGLTFFVFFDLSISARCCHVLRLHPQEVVQN